KVGVDGVLTTAALTTAALTTAVLPTSVLTTVVLTTIFQTGITSHHHTHNGNPPETTIRSPSPKFYENLSSKARPKHRAPQAADEHNLAQRLEAKLQAAEHKRMQILKANSQRRAILSQKASHSLPRTNALHSKVTIVPTFWPNNSLRPELSSTQSHRLKPLKVLPFGEMQVTEHQKLLGETIMHLSGEAGMVRLRNALSDTRRQYSKSKEKSSSVEPPVTHIVPSNAGPDGRSDSVDQLPFSGHDSMSPLEDTGSSGASGSGSVNNSDGEMLGMENVFIVNEFLHGRRYGDNDSLNITDENQKVRETMEKAFWDGISDSVQQEKKQEILEVIDLDILSQLLSSRCLDIKYLGTIMDKARINILEPVLKGPAGLEYLGKAFTKVYGPPSDALIRLPLTMQWLSSVVPGKDQEWNEHMKALSDLQQHLSSERTALPSTALRTGGHFPSRLQTSPAMSLTDTAGSSRSSSNSQNVAFLSAKDTKSINEVNTTNGSNSPQLDDEDLEQIDHDDLKEMTLNGKRGHFARECRAPRNQGNRNGDAMYRNMDNNKRIVPVESFDALVVQDNALIVQDILGYD
nr:hypothetical protein [Tanacetum cinerariifolium]